MTAFTRYQDAARALFNGAELSAKQGQFVGGLAFSDGELTEKQREWLVGLLRRHNLPQIEGIN